MSPDDTVIMLNDPDWVVRYKAAQRVAPEALACLCNDPEPDVRAVVQERLNQHSQNTPRNKKPGAVHE
jgi:hypothetical protein